MLIIGIYKMEIKHIVDMNRLMCPFCEHAEVITTKEEIIGKNGEVAVYGEDYWECLNCGEENDIGLECLEKDFKLYRKFTEKENWDGLLKFCLNNKFDDFILYSLAKYYIQKQEFKKSLNIANVLYEMDPMDINSIELIDKSKKGLEFMKSKEKEFDEIY